MFFSHRNSGKPSTVIIILFCIALILQPEHWLLRFNFLGDTQGLWCWRMLFQGGMRAIAKDSGFLVSMPVSHSPLHRHHMPNMVGNSWFTGLGRNPSYAHYPRALGHLDPQINDPRKEAFANREIEFSSIKDICISYFSLCCGQMPDKKPFKEGRPYLAYSSGRCCLFWQGRHGSRQGWWSKLVALHLQSESQE